MKPIKKAALLHSMCSVGKASLTNMIPVLSTMGIEACPIPTVILSTHTGGYGMPARQPVSAEYIRACADHYRENQMHFDLIFIGYLGNPEMVSAIQYFVEQFPDAEVILDPIMGDHGKFYMGLGNEYATAFHKLFPLVDVIVPNMTEACVLCGMEYHDVYTQEELDILCNIFHKSGIETVILTSVSDQHGKKGMVLSDDGRMDMISMEREPFDFHGSGDVFDAVLIGSHLQEKTWVENLEKAHYFVAACIRDSASYHYPEREGLMVENNLSLLV